MRSPLVTRLYLQCAPDESLDAWPDERIWAELRARFATREDWVLHEGPITQRGITAMRAFVVELAGADDSQVQGILDGLAVASGPGLPAVAAGQGALVDPDRPIAHDPEAGEPL